jgi:hypothetical protein
VRAGHFDVATRCLAAGLRARYSAELLARDFQAEPGAQTRLERAVLAAEGIPQPDGPRMRFPLAGGGAVVVAQEADGWRLEALE